MKATIEMSKSELETLSSFYECGMCMSDISNAEEDEIIYKILQAFGVGASTPVLRSENEEEA